MSNPKAPAATTPSSTGDVPAAPPTDSPNTAPAPAPAAFAQLGLLPPLLDALTALKFEEPTSIQRRAIAPILAGHDLVGQAQTGTGKTAAFALPLLARIDLHDRRPQVLVLAPTRELAIQVTRAFSSFARGMRGFNVLTVYGGQDYAPQLRALRKGVHVVVGTPGRVNDHLRRKTLDLQGLKALVLDEADEMLNMGFLEDVELVLDQAPAGRQMALFSATMPPAIRRVAAKYLNEPVEVFSKSRPTPADTIHQRQLLVRRWDKPEALGRILEVEPYDAALVFVRTRAATVEVANALEARGFSVAALNGEMSQSSREHTVDRLRKGHLGVMVATDVAARGLDVERISHVINYDAPQNAEAYVHRIGRTGRAGRGGEAILLLQPNERRLVQTIERTTRRTIERMTLPSTAAINKRRVAQFLDRITNVLAREKPLAEADAQASATTESPDSSNSLKTPVILPKSLTTAQGRTGCTDLSFFRKLVEQYLAEHPGRDAVDAAAALALLLQGAQPLLLPDPPERQKPRFDRRKDRGVVRLRSDRGPRSDGPGDPADGRSRRREGRRPTNSTTQDKPRRSARARTDFDTPMEAFRLEVGHAHGVKPGNIFGAIANEAGLDSEFIGRIDIFDEHSTIELPEGMPRSIFRALKRVWICQRQLQITKVSPMPKAPPRPSKHQKRPPRKPSKKPPRRPHKPPTG